MDPNAVLAKLRLLAGEIIKATDSEEPASAQDASERFGRGLARFQRTVDIASKAADLAEAFQNLDEWLSRGGFKPDAWDGKTRCSKCQRSVGVTPSGSLSAHYHYNQSMCPGSGTKVTK